MDRDIAEAFAQVEQRQSAYEIVSQRLIGMLEVHNEKLDAILAAATIDPGPSPTAELLNQILATMREQTALLRELPDAISETIRDEMQREFVEDEAEWELGQDDGSQDEAGKGKR